MGWKELVDAWRKSADSQQMNPRASLDELQEVEERLGYSLPGPLREFYRFSNGATLAHGNLKIYPLQPQTIQIAKPFVNPFRPQDPPRTQYTTAGLLTQTSFLREHHWPIAAEVLVFGDTGSDSLYGIRLPQTLGPTFVHPIVVIGEIFDTPRNMAVIGTNLLRFLYAVTTYWLLNAGDDGAALDAIAVPAHLRQNAAGDALFSQILKWADPKLPSYDPNPYDRGNDALELGKLFHAT